MQFARSTTASACVVASGLLAAFGDPGMSVVTSVLLLVIGGLVTPVVLIVLWERIATFVNEWTSHCNRVMVKVVRRYIPRRI